MKAFEIPQDQTPLPHLLVDEALAKIDAMIAQRIEQHRDSFQKFWDNDPDAQLERMGTNAIRWLQFASASYAHIQQMEQILGVTLLTTEFWQPRRDFIINPQTGEVTLAL